MTYYAVANGRNPGIYLSWSECRKQVIGFPNARYKKFATRLEAQHFINPQPKSQPKPVLDLSEIIRDDEIDSNEIDDKVIDEPITVFTDGACKMQATGRRAGYGFYIPSRDLKVSKPLPSKAGYDLTNNRAELTAIIEALRIFPRGSKVRVVSDSTYCQLIFNGTGQRYASKDFKERGKPVKNRDLVEMAVELAGQYELFWQHVNSHTGATDPLSLGNAIADQLASDACGGLCSA